MPAHVLALSAIIAYLAAAATVVLPQSGGNPRAQRWALVVAALAALAHATLLFGLHRGGLDLHFFAALSLVGFAVALLTLIVNLFRPVAGLGVIVFPLAAVLLAVDVFVAPPTQPSNLDWQINLHVILALIAYSLLSIAALLAILLALQERALRNRRIDSRLIRSLPPLTLTEALMFQVIAAGFIGLTATLLSGVLFVDNLFAQHLVHKTVLSIIAWIVFGILLFGRWRWGWRGGRAVQLTLAGMVILLFAFFGSKFVLEVVLQRTA